MATRPMKTITGLPGLEGNTYTFVQIDNQLATAGKAADAKAVGDALAEIDETLPTKANVDGSYEQMTVGNAEQLVATVGIEDKVPYNFRTSGGANDIGDREVDKVIGGTVAWNQLVYTTGDWSVSDNGSGTRSGNNVTVKPTTANKTYGAARASDIKYYYPQGHKYFFYFKVTEMSENVTGAGIGFNGNITMVQAPGEKAFIKSPTSNYMTIQAVISGSSNLATTEYAVFSAAMCIDLTLLFGSTIADYIYNLEQSTAGAGVAFFRSLFPAPYYAYNAGELMHVQTSAHKMTGFNQWDEEWESGYITYQGALEDNTHYFRSKNYIPIFPSTVYFYKCPSDYSDYARFAFYDANKNFVSYVGTSNYLNHTFTTPSNAYFMKFTTGEKIGAGVTYRGDICINISWDGERDGEYEPYEAHTYPLDDVELRGIPKLDANNNLYYDGDTYEADGTVTRKYGIVDLGTFTTWAEYSGYPGLFYVNATPSGAKIPASNSTKPNIVCDSYLAAISRDIGTTGHTKGEIALATNRIYVSNGTYSGNVAGFKSAIQGVYLVYELATPTTEEADPYQETQICNDFGTEEFIDTRTVPIPVGHASMYQSNLRAKLEMAPDSPADGDGDYIVRQTNGENAYVKLVIPTELPTSPTEDGSYHLKCTVASGTATLSWESDT